MEHQTGTIANIIFATPTPLLHSCGKTFDARIEAIDNLAMDKSAPDIIDKFRTTFKSKIFAFYMTRNPLIFIREIAF